jgi:Fe-S-cluster containining protein
VVRSQARHDQRLAAASDAGTLACKAGCFWCCYFSVDVRPVEVFRILQFMEQELTAQDRARIQRQITNNQQLLADVDRETRVRLNVRCPFLNEGRCSIYAARPQTCRNYHATNVVGCQRSYEHPEDLDIDPEFAPLTYQIGIAHVDGFAKAMEAAGYDHRAYEMNAALAHVLNAPESARHRFESRQPPFGEVEGEPVPLEFED